MRCAYLELLQRRRGLHRGGWRVSNHLLTGCSWFISDRCFDVTTNIDCHLLLLLGRWPKVATISTLVLGGSCGFAPRGVLLLSGVASRDALHLELIYYVKVHAGAHHWAVVGHGACMD